MRIAIMGSGGVGARVAREDRQLAATVEQWDAEPWLFNAGDQHE